MSEQPDVSEGDLTWDELSWSLELGCWASLILAPILYFINGPSVSADQAVVRMGLVIISAIGGILLRMVNRRRLSSTRAMSDD